MTPLDRLYARIPKVEGCIKGCVDCCGPVPVLPPEAERIQHIIPLDEGASGEKQTPTKYGCTTCAYAVGGGCSIYDARPMMCRLFAAVDDPLLTCPHGAKAKKPLTQAEGWVLIRKYQDLV